MMQNWPGLYKEILSVPALGSAGPLWTLSVEWHIYMFVGAVFFLGRVPHKASLLIVAATFSTVPFVYFFGDVQPELGTGLFALWLMEFAGYFMLAKGYCLNWQKFPLVIVSVGCLLGYLFLLPAGNEYDPRVYPLLAVAFVSMVVLASKIPKNKSIILNRAIRVGADYWFSLTCFITRFFSRWRVFGMAHPGSAL
jgi:peptidoglycan/LPS O-acetylase OafA/YrhL